MSARGDMMPKDISLTDMLFRNAEGTSRENARAAAKPPRRADADFLPEPRQVSRDGSPAAAKSFKDRVAESRERLERKDHSFFHQGARADARPAERSREQAKPADPKAQEAGRRDAAEDARIAKPVRNRNKQAEKPEADRAGREGMRNDRAAAAGDGKESGTVRPEEKAVRDMDRPGRNWAAGEARPVGLDAEAAGAEGAALQGDWDDTGMGGFDALQARLEELGIEATPEQLRDPAFLAEMLWMIDALPMASPLFEGTAPAGVGPETVMAGPVEEVEGTEADLLAVAKAALAGETAGADGDSPVQAAAVANANSNANSNAKSTAGEAGEGFDWTAVSEPEREEIAALIREKLGALSDRAQFRAGPEVAGRLGDQALPAAVQFARAGAEAPAAPMEANPVDLTFSDPDRLRVLQAGLAGRDLAGAAVLDGRQAPVDFSLETDEGPDSESLARNLAGSTEAGGAEAEGDMEGQPNLAGRNAFQNASADSLAGKDGLAAKDSSAAFHGALDQARVQDARAAAQRPAAPMPHQGSPFEQTVMSQIARKMSALGLRGTEEIRIQLEPEHLGRVRINLELRGGALTARIGVENESVRQMVDANIAGLREGLESQGLKLQGLEVSVEQRHSSLFNPDGSNAGEFFQRRGRGGSGDGAEAVPEEAPESDTGRRLGYNTMEFIA